MTMTLYKIILMLLNTILMNNINSDNDGSEYKIILISLNTISFMNNINKPVVAINANGVEEVEGSHRRCN